MTDFEPRRPRAALLPQACFDHPAPHRRPGNILPAQAVAQLDLLVRKACAGMRQDLRVSGARLRRAFITGAFGERDAITLRWAIPGLRPERFPTLHSLCALTVYELARGLRATLGPDAGGYARELNRWAERPARPLPSAAGWVLYTDACGCTRAGARRSAPRGPRRVLVPRFGRPGLRGANCGSGALAGGEMRHSGAHAIYLPDDGQVAEGHAHRTADPA